MIFTKGMRDKLDHFVHPSGSINIDMSIDGSATYDYCCFCLDANGKLYNRNYMVFYNQTVTPQHEIIYTAGNNRARFTLSLNRLPVSITRLIFTVSIDGNGTMGSIGSQSTLITEVGYPGLGILIPGSDFLLEKSIIAFELIRQDGWGVNVISAGFDGNLDALLKYFGGVASEPNEVIAPVIPAATPSAPAGTGKICLKKTEEDLTREAMNKICLTKDKVNLEKHIINLSKTVINISQQNEVDLGSTKAKVVIVLDYSGSMNCLYSDGTVQRTLNKLVPLGLTFDDNGSIDVYLFQNDYFKLPDMTLDNYEDYVFGVVKKSGYRIGGTNYAPVLNAIVDDLGLAQTKAVRGMSNANFSTHGFDTAEPSGDSDPAFILFITDGENALADKPKSDEIIRAISTMNTFVQFIGIGDEDFEYLKKLDTLAGRARNNTGFAEMPDLNKYSDEELYTIVLEQYSRWLKGIQ